MTDEAARRVKGFLGLCHRAGVTVLGQDACVSAVRSGAAAVLLMDEGSSENSRKRFEDSCQSHGVRLYVLPSGLISEAVGRDGRMAAALKKCGMASRMLEIIGKTGDSNDMRLDK